MGSKRSPDDPASDTAAADADAGPAGGTAAATVQPSSSSEQQFVNEGMEHSACGLKYIVCGYESFLQYT